MRDIMEFLSFMLCTSITVLIIVTITFIGINYWVGTSRALLIKKQTGIEYTWREAAQINHMYDQSNVKIIFDKDKNK